MRPLLLANELRLTALMLLISGRFVPDEERAVWKIAWFGRVWARESRGPLDRGPPFAPMELERFNAEAGCGIAEL